MLVDLPQRERALDPAASFIVQAPAGSGKTGLLIRRILKLLANVSRPEEVLAITFTVKAAAEMRSRLLGALRSARDDTRPEDDYEGAIYDDACRVLARDKELQWRLLQAPARLRIMTVDALNSRLVQAMPVTSQSGGTALIMDNSECSRLYSQAAEATLDWLGEDPNIGQSVSDLLTHLDSSLYRWRAHLSVMLATREQWLGPVLMASESDELAIRQSSERMLSDMVSERLQRADQLFPSAPRQELIGLLLAASERLSEQDPGSKLLRDQLPTHWPSSEAASLPQWRAIANCCLIGTASFRRQVNKNNGFPPTEKEAKTRTLELLDGLSTVPGLAELLDEVRKMPEPHYTEQQWRVVKSILRVLPAAAAELLRLMREQGVTDYSQLAANAMYALGDSQSDDVSDLALRLDYQISHILVDEMQDTSARQYQLLEKLTAGWQPDDGRTLFCVGDPMQSIYRFRGAQVTRFLSAWDEGIGGLALTPITLGTNFRSDEKIIDWVNETFQILLGSRNSLATDKIAYSPSVAKPTASAQGQVVWHPSINDKANEPARVVEVTKQLLSKEPTSSIAILARSRNHLREILEQLRVANIDCHALEIDRLTDLPEVVDLLALTRALAHAGDRIAWLGLLRAPWLGVSIADIDRLMLVGNETPAEPVISLLRTASNRALLDVQSQAAVTRFLTIYDSIQSRSATLGLRDRVEFLWATLGGPALLDTEAQVENAWRYLDALGALEERGSLKDVSRLEANLDELRVSRESPGASVTAMTIYKSKGLEFDHVLLPSLQSKVRTNTKPALFWEFSDRQEGAQILFSALASETDASTEPLHEMLWQRDQERALNESDRLLYVACTRARRTLHLFADVNHNKAGDELRKPYSGSLLSRLWPCAESIFEQEFADFVARDALPAGEPMADEGSHWLQPHRRWVEEPFEWPSTLAAPIELKSLVSPSNQFDIEFDWAGESARHVGTVVHGWLQRIAGAKDPAVTLGDLAHVAQRSRVLLMQMGVITDQLTPATERVIGALQSMLADETGRKILTNSHTDSACELALAANLGGTVKNIVIDRVLRDEQGQLWIIDYKTSFHEGGNIGAFFASECERYGQQLELYRQIVEAYFLSLGRETGPIHLALYFPLHAHFQPLSSASPSKL